MLITKTVKATQMAIAAARAEGKTVGFVPTMGALHEGHLSLIKRAKRQTEFTVCSIFVNPTQFDDKGDLKHYPRPIERDRALLESVDCDLLFLPPVEEVYPKDAMNEKLNYDFGYIDQPMEGEFRKGHFDGVAQVVNRLLDIVIPDQLFMGQKDYQQFLIIKKLIELTKRPTELVRCDIVREADGLAMSSRNVRMAPKERQKAVWLSKTLKETKTLFEQGYAIPDLEKRAITQLNSIEGIKVVYFDIVDAENLKKVTKRVDGQQLIACVAVFLHPVRLIDNMLLN